MFLHTKDLVGIKALCLLTLVAADARQLLSSPRLRDAQVLALWDKWNDALLTLDPRKVTALYAHDAVLVPTVSNKIRMTHAEIKDYFRHFLENKPVGTINDYTVRWPCGDVVDFFGTYTFRFRVTNSTVQARFSYQFKDKNRKWLIIEHHSSAMPELANGSLPIERLTHRRTPAALPSAALVPPPSAAAPQPRSAGSAAPPPTAAAMPAAAAVGGGGGGGRTSSTAPAGTAATVLKSSLLAVARPVTGQP